MEKRIIKVLMIFLVALCIGTLCWSQNNKGTNSNTNIVLLFSNWSLEDVESRCIFFFTLDQVFESTRRLKRNGFNYKDICVRSNYKINQ